MGVHIVNPWLVTLPEKWLPFSSVICRKLQNWWRRRQNIETPDLNEYTRWELDYDLNQYPAHGLFYEYLEMGKKCTQQITTQIRN